jgi:hypothetical protein
MEHGAWSTRKGEWHTEYEAWSMKRGACIDSAYLKLGPEARLPLHRLHQVQQGGGIGHLPSPFYVSLQISVHQNVGEHVIKVESEQTGP